jgi:hypothetical protein
MDCKALKFSGHALRRMFERSISPSDVRKVVEAGQVIESYPNDYPYPSILLLGFANGQPLHVVLGYNEAAEECHVVTAYHPDPTQWDNTFKTRRTP